MLYYPKNMSAKELLKKAGFVPANNRGMVVERKKQHQKPGKPVQIHAIIRHDNVIDLHEDRIGKDGLHVSFKGIDPNRRHPRLERFMEILEQADNGEEIRLGSSLKKHYWFGGKPTPETNPRSLKEIMEELSL